MKNKTDNIPCVVRPAEADDVISIAFLLCMREVEMESGGKPALPEIVKRTRSSEYAKAAQLLVADRSAAVHVAEANKQIIGLAKATLSGGIEVIIEKGYRSSALADQLKAMTRASLSLS